MGEPQRHNTSRDIVIYLQQRGVGYEEIEHPPAASALEYHELVGTQLNQQAKALFVRYRKPGEKGFAVVTIQAQKKADLEKIRELLGAKSVGLATKEQLEVETNCRFGELPPFGKLFGVRLLMDRDLLAEEKVYFNAGRLDYSLAVNPLEIQRIEDPILF